MFQTMDAMGGVGEISVVTKDEEKNYRLTIADSGPGISEGNLNKIFDPFFTTKDPGKGTGLGLSICHQIVENHGATISCTSQEGKGAQFHILFPKSNMEGKEGLG